MNHAPAFLLYLNVLVVATCGLIYELLAGTLASYVLGDSVTQFSLIIGVYLSALGVGAWLSRFVDSGLARCFLEVELGVALLGGLSAPILFLSFAWLAWFRVVLFGLVFLIGTLVGLELPLLMRILQGNVDFRDLVSRVLAFDYLGALFASILFPLFFVPRLGLVRTSLVFGAMNALVALWGTSLLRPLLKGGTRGLRVRALIVLGVLAAGLFQADRLTLLAEESRFQNPVVFARTTPYQRIVVTRTDHSFQLFLNGNLQFNSVDEYRYHEALVHPAMSLRPRTRRVLMLGGGDGLAVRELLRYPQIESITLVDIDPGMTGLSREFAPLRDLNGGGLDDPRVTIVNQDALIWLEESGEPFDIALVDFPDPSTFSLRKLYTTRFYRLLKQRLRDDAAVAIQCTSPLTAPRSYWCILRTMESAGFIVRPYHAAVPSFGVWGYALASVNEFATPERVLPEVAGGLRYLNDAGLRQMFELPLDLSPRDVEINRLDNQILVRYYEDEWARWN